MAKKKKELIGLDELKDLSQLKEMNPEQLSHICQEIRERILQAVSSNGGHLSSNLGVVELTVALFRHFDFLKDKLIFDVGHQCYAQKILTGRDISVVNKRGGIYGFQKRSESPYDVWEAGHSSTSLSAAQAFAYARDQRGEDYAIVALIGDSSIVNGLAFEALNNIGSRPNKVIIVLNDNDMSISRPVGGLGNFFRKISTARFYNKAKMRARRHVDGHRGFYRFTARFKRAMKAALVPTTMFDNMGFTYMGPVNGHDFRALENAFKRAENAIKPVVIHVYTRKGKGYKPAEENPSIYHGVGPFPLETGIPDSKESKTYSQFMGDYIHQRLSEDENLRLICAAMLIGSNLESSFKDFPKQCLDMGIAEEHAITFAGALSLTGYHPVVSMYSSFLQRAYDEILHDCARIKSDMTLLVDHVGTNGRTGETHAGIYDEAFMRSIPDVTLAMPSTLGEMKALFEQSLEPGHGVYAIRLTEENAEPGEPIGKLEYGKWIELRKAKKSALIGVGLKGRQLMERVKESNQDCGLINPIFLNPILPENIDLIKDCERVFLYDPYGTEAGFASSLALALAKAGFHGKLETAVIPDVFVPMGTCQEQAEQYGLDLETAFKRVSEFL